MESNGVGECTCGLAKSEGLVVECVNCGTWRHGACSSIKGEIPGGMDGSTETIQSYCGNCASKLKNNKICLLSNCRNNTAPGSEFCSPEHAAKVFEQKLLQSLESSDPKTREFFKSKLRKYKQPSAGQVKNENGDDGLLKQQLPPIIPPASFPPIKETPMYTLPTEDKLNPIAFSKLREGIQNREEKDVCGFSKSYFAIARGDVETEIIEPCEKSVSACSFHRNWPQMIEFRMKNAAMSESERVIPDTAWITGSKQIIEPGTVRIHSALEMETKHFIPYVWDNRDTEYYLEM